MESPAPFAHAALAAFFALAPCLTPVRAQDLPDPPAVLAAMQQATQFYVSKLASQGGYASSWTKDLSEARVEGKKSKTVISIQPPGTTTVGLALLRAWQATGDEIFLQGARDAAQALINCQLESGGWPADFDFGGEDPQRWFLRQHVLAGDTDPGKRRNLSTLDDNKSQSALLFLLEFAHDPAARDDQELQAAMNYGFERVLAAQTMIGSWPQQFSGPAAPDGIVRKATIPAEWPRVWPRENYLDFHTLNDNNLRELVGLMLRAHQLTGEARFLASAKRVGDFLLLAQFEGKQPGWAQQYNQEMVPVWARKFEPPALSSTESLGACETLFEIWLATGEEKYRAAIPPALDWLERSRLPEGRWARFYEFTSNRPLYCVAETYELTYDDSNLPTHYSFKPDSLEGKIDRLRQTLARPREELLATRQEPSSPEQWAKVARSQRDRVKSALASRNTEGVWLEGDEIRAELFSKHLSITALYLKAHQNSQTQPPN